MTSVVLSIGSNLGDRMAQLQSVVDGLGDARRARCRRSTRPTRGAASSRARSSMPLCVADDPALDAHGWLRRAHELEDAAQRVRDQRWGPRTLDVDLVTWRMTASGEVTVARRRPDPAAPATRMCARSCWSRGWPSIRTPTLTVAGQAGRSRTCCWPTSTRPNATEYGGTASALRVRDRDLMGPTRKRDLAAAVVAAAVLGYLLVRVAVPVVPADHGVDRDVAAGRRRSPSPGGASTSARRIRDGEIGDGPGRLHPLAVARSVLIAKASAWMGAVVLGWWLAVCAYLLPRRGALRVAAEDTAGAVVAGLCALALVSRGAVATALLQVSRRRRRRTPIRRRAEPIHPVQPAESPERSTRAVTCGGYSRPMTDPTRGARIRRSGRRPGWILMTVLLVLAIVASSALVFTNRVELLKLAVILALWAAVVAAFVSVIYRRQSDTDQAKVRDLKLVYDLQLDREISARREYELTVESQLRRELAAELRAQAADEVAALRAELAALRANLEYLFDADLSHRPAIETDRAAAPSFTDWAPRPEAAGRVRSSRIDTEETAILDEIDDHSPDTEESPIIDVPAEPHPPEDTWPPAAEPVGGAHRRAGEREPAAAPWTPPPPSTPQPPPPSPQFPWLPPQAPQAPPPSEPMPEPTPEPEPAPAASSWQPAPAEGR